jgi:ABC-2 type transport system permease protein
MTELLLATCLLGVLRALLNIVVLGVLAYILYAFNLFSMGLALVPFLANLLLFGWALGMSAMALLVRFGLAAEALAWAVPYMIQPVSAVFYPVDVFPKWLQTIAHLVPSTHIFEGMRAALRTGTVDASTLLAALALNLVYLTLSATFFGWMLQQAREKGYLSHTGMQ